MHTTTIRLSDTAKAKLDELCRVRQWSQSDCVRFWIEQDWQRNRDVIVKSRELAAIAQQLEKEPKMDRVAEVNKIRELAANIAANLGEGTAGELVEYALSSEGREAWGVDIKLDAHDRGLLVQFVGENL